MEGNMSYGNPYFRGKSMTSRLKNSPERLKDVTKLQAR